MDRVAAAAVAEREVAAKGVEEVAKAVEAAHRVDPKDRNHRDMDTLHLDPARPLRTTDLLR